MAKAKRQRRNSIRTMAADSSALEALESLERAERSATPETAAGDRGRRVDGHHASARPRRSSTARPASRGRS